MDSEGVSIFTQALDVNANLLSTTIDSISIEIIDDINNYNIPEWKAILIDKDDAIIETKNFSRDKNITFSMNVVENSKYRIHFITRNNEGLENDEYLVLDNIKTNAKPELIANELSKEFYSENLGHNKISLSGKVKDIDLNDELKIYYSIEGQVNHQNKSIATILSDGDAQSYNHTLTVDSSISEGTHSIYMWVEDNRGGKSDIETLTFKVDKTPPTIDNLDVEILTGNKIKLSGSAEDVFVGLDNNPFLYERYTNEGVEYTGFESEHFIEIVSGFSTGDSSWVAVEDWTSGSIDIDLGSISNVQYMFRFKAKDKLGNESDYSNEVSGFTPASKPINLTYKNIRDSELTISWGSNNNSPTTKYQIERKLSTDNDTEYVQVGETTQLEFIDNGLIHGTSYVYRVRALNGENIATDFIIGDTVITIPEAPTILAVANKSENNNKSITITWTEVSGADEYVLYLYGEIVADGIKGTQYTHEGLVANKEYEYTLRAKNISGLSENSEKVSLYTQALSLTELSILNVNKSSIKIKLTNDSNNAVNPETKIEVLDTSDNNIIFSIDFTSEVENMILNNLSVGNAYKIIATTRNGDNKVINTPVTILSNFSLLDYVNDNIGDILDNGENSELIDIIEIIIGEESFNELYYPTPIKGSEISEDEYLNEIKREMKELAIKPPTKEDIEFILALLNINSKLSIGREDSITEKEMKIVLQHEAHRYVDANLEKYQDALKDKYGKNGEPIIRIDEKDILNIVKLVNFNELPIEEITVEVIKDLLGESYDVVDKNIEEYRDAIEELRKSNPNPNLDEIREAVENADINVKIKDKTLTCQELKELLPNSNIVCEYLNDYLQELSKKQKEKEDALTLDEIGEIINAVNIKKEKERQTWSGGVYHEPVKNDDTSKLVSIPTSKELGISYDKYVDVVRRTYGTLDLVTPISRFDVVVDGNNSKNSYTVTGKPPWYKSTDNDILSDMEFMDKIKTGDSVSVIDRSVVGSGNKIVDWDWQIVYEDEKGNVRHEQYSTAKDIKINTSHEGYVYILLNVADDYKPFDGEFKNYSEYGNWNNNEKYYTVAKFKVSTK